MHSLGRPRPRDWPMALAAGASLGFLFLGIGARVGMRIVALASAQPTAFTVEGSVAVILLGALTGAVVAAIFLLVRIVISTSRWVRGAVFWGVCGALALRGISPITLLNATVFLPLFLLHGVLLHAFWCRIYLPRVRPVGAGA